MVINHIGIVHATFCYQFRNILTKQNFELALASLDLHRHVQKVYRLITVLLSHKLFSYLWVLESKQMMIKWSFQKLNNAKTKEKLES